MGRMPSPKIGRKGLQMKKNSTGQYEHDNSIMYARDPETGEEMVYFIAEKQKLNIRSVFEEDADTIGEIQQLKKRFVRIYRREFSKEDARYKHFVIEELENFQPNGAKKIVADLNLKDDNKMETCIYIKRDLNPRLAQIVRARVVGAIDAFCDRIGGDFELKVYRPAEM